MSSVTMTPDLDTEDEGNVALPLKELLFPGGDGDLVNTEGLKVTSDVIEGKTLGILVGPSWWKTLMLDHIIPTFADTIQEIVDGGKPLQMLYVSFARDENLIEDLTNNERGGEIDSGSHEESFSSFIKTLPTGWLAVPLSNPQAIEKLTEVSESRVVGMAFVGADGHLITTEARELLVDWGADAFPFTEERVKELAEPFTKLKESPSLKGLLETAARDYLIKNDGTQVKISSLKGPIGIYFSAHWCPPCRRFTPVLSSVYDKLKEEGKHFEVVFVSWDRDEEAFKEYFGTMPWLALPFSDKKGRKILDKVYDVQGIPSLVILDSDANIQQEDAIDIISEFKADAYPFTQDTVEELQAKLNEAKEAARSDQSLESLLVTGERDYVVDHEGNEIKVSSLDGKTVGLYFSAHWCPPCKTFTPVLANIYKELKEAGKPFEIIFLSSDTDEEGFKEYFAEMPWLALPYNDRQNTVNTKQYLAEYFEVKGIPSLVLLGPDGKTVNRDGRSTLERFGAKAFPFAKNYEVDLLKSLDDEIQKLPVEVKISNHEHPLKLMRVPYTGETFGCDYCGGGGNRWAYRCEDCGYDVETECVKKALATEAAQKEDAKVETETTETNGDVHGEVKEGWICEGDVCRKA